MRSIRRKGEALASLALFVGAASLLFNGAACSGALAPPIPAAHPDDPTPRRGGILRLASIGEARRLDPAVLSDALAASAIRLMFDGLVDYDEEKRIVPVLAERWELADEGATYRFFLRQGIRFHDGEELTAEDVRRSIERALHPRTPNPNASLYDALVGFDEYATGAAPHLAGITVEGRYVVSMRLKRPDATFLPKLALPPLRPVCRSAGERYSDGWHPCGTGPFKLPLDGWARGSSLTLVRHDGYFERGLPYLDGVMWLYNMTQFTQRFKLEAGELDIYRDATQAEFSRFHADPRWASLGEAEAETSVAGEGMNVRVAPFDNVEVRRAVAAAIDRDHYAAIKASSLRPAYQPIPPSVPGYNPAIGQRHDHAAALEHMRRAGFAYDPATGKGGYPHVVTYWAYGNSLPEFTSQLLQQDLATIGIRIRIHLVTFPAWLAAYKTPGKTQMHYASQSQDFPDPSDFLEPLFSGKAINAEDSNNSSFYANPELDELLAKARGEIDSTRRQRLYDEATKIVCDDAPWAFTFYNHAYEIRQPYVRGYRPHPIFSMHVARAWIDRAASPSFADGRTPPPLRRVLASIIGGRR